MAWTAWNVVTGWKRHIFYTINVLLHKMLLDDLKQYVLYLAIIIISINLAVENQMITPKNRVRSARGAGKRKRIQHSNRISKFHKQNDGIFASITSTVISQRAFGLPVIH